MDDVVGLTVGRRLRRRRRLLGMTQQALGDACGVTFQQIQKYESASCRVSATVLWRLSRALDVEVNYFFDGLEDSVPRLEPRRRRSAPDLRETPLLRIAV
jgi:transcriptional regulator with XRE-family HTH domain